MRVSARLVANCFLDLAARDHLLVSPLKIQKLVYLAHGWSLALREEPLIFESPEAWRYGPVIPELYNVFKKFGGSAIKEKVPVKAGEADKLDEAGRNLIESVWNKYKKFSASQLSTLTHEPGSAWQVTIKDSWPFEPLTISDGLITEEFQRRLQRAHARAAS